jgi:chemotaxis protein CheY-P-specific phosphatase CheC
MREMTSEAIAECLAEALETSAFISVEPPPDEFGSPEDAEVMTLRFQGSMSGAVQIAAPQRFAAALAASILAMDPESAEAAAAGQDAIKELCNVATGVLLNRLFEPEETLPEMALPSAAGISAAAWNEFVKHPSATVMFAEGHPLAVRVIGE